MCYTTIMILGSLLHIFFTVLGSSFITEPGYIACADKI